MTLYCSLLERGRGRRERCLVVNEVPADPPRDGSITVGLAQLEPDDTASLQPARADAALYTAHENRNATSPFDDTKHDTI